MIVYADTSALVKLVIQEFYSEETRAFFEEADVIGTSLLTRVEMRAAFARGMRGGLFSVQETEMALRWMQSAWESWAWVQVDMSLVSLASDLAWTHGLRGYDAVHLASALVWQHGLGEPIVLATFD